MHPLTYFISSVLANLRSYLMDTEWAKNELMQVCFCIFQESSANIIPNP